MAQTTVKNSVKVKSSKRSKHKPSSNGAAYLDKADPVVRTQFAETLDLPSFRDTVDGSLSKEDRLTLVQQALVIMAENYVHLPLKEAMHAIDPVQRLRLLQDQIRNTPPAQLSDEQTFHREMISIFMSVRDLHTNYLLPNPYNRMVAFIPFTVDDYFEDGERKYVVSHVFPSFSQPPFDRGVEVVRWNGIPIELSLIHI